MVNGPHPSAANVSQVNELFSTFPNSFFLLYNSCEKIIIMTEPFLILFEIRLIIVKNLMEFFSASKKVILDWYKQFICRRGPWCTFESRQATWFSMTKQQSGHASKTKTALSAQCWDPSPRYETLELAWTDSSPEMRVNNLWMAGQGSHSAHLLSVYSGLAAQSPSPPITKRYVRPSTNHRPLRLSSALLRAQRAVGARHSLLCA